MRMVMDLGKAKLLRTGLNALLHAIHPVHGLAWTDGKQVILTALQFDEEPTFGNSVVVGQFEHVLGLNWGPVFGNDMPALLAVQHRKHVTIWRLFYDPLEKSKLIVSQTCEIGNPFPVLPNGCVWHPYKDILVVLTKRDLSVLDFATSNSEHIKEDIKGGGVIRCASWTRDGCRVVVAVNSTLHSYIWDNAQKTFTPCSFCPVFEIDGTIDAIQPTRGNQIVVTTGIPTDDIHSWKKNMPSDGSSIESSLLILDKELSLNRRRPSTDSGRSEPADLIKTSPLLSPDLSQILARHRKSDPSHLIHFRHKFFSNVAKPRVSRLVIVSFEKNSTTARKISIPGIVSPDILAIDSHATRVAIASNTSNHCLVYPITPYSRSGIQEVKLGENERAKGICFLTDTILLVMVGQQKPVDVTFLPLSDTVRYLVHLTCKRIMASETSSLPLQSGENSKSDCIQRPYALDNTILCGDTLNKELLMPSSIGVQPSNGHKKVNDGIIRDNPCENSLTSDLEDLQVEPVSRILRTNQNPNAEDLIRTSSLGLHDHQNPSNMSENDHYSSEKEEFVSLDPNLVNDKQMFSDQYVGLCDMKVLQRNFTEFHPYPFSEDPDYVSVACQNSSRDGEEEKKSILLCHGKLPLRTLQQCFQITSVEIKLGPVWITLTEDREGFIPLIFRANQEVIIRNAAPTASHN